MKQYLTRSAIGLLAVSAVCAMGALTSPANAAAQTFKDHESFDVSGAVFPCQGGDLTVTAGSISQTVEGVQDGQGTFHITGTLVPHGVTLTDGTNTYSVSGADWFGGKSLDPDGNLIIVSTDTSHFVIRNASGGVYAMVQITEHMSANNTFVFDRGQCETPNG